MKQKTNCSNLINKSLKVIITNPPNKVEAIEMIKKISEKLSKNLSDKLIELEEIKWKIILKIMIMILI